MLISNTSEIDFILNHKIAFEVKHKAVESDYKKLSLLAGALDMTSYFVISKTFSDYPNSIYPFFL